MMDSVCSYRVMMAGACWVLAVAVGLAAWLARWPDLRPAAVAFVCIASTLTVINDNARTRRAVRLSAGATEPVRTLR
jgi:hypothetical protein